jgi:hypothetical protein
LRHTAFVKVKQKQTRTAEVDAVVDVICNKCGESMVTASAGYVPDRVVGRNYLGLLDGSVAGCYGSELLLDTHRYRFSLCERCIVGMFDRFKVPPTVTEYEPGDRERDVGLLTWAEDRAIRAGMDDRSDPLQCWECACEDPIVITVGRLDIYWYRNLLFRYCTEEDGLVVVRLACLGLEGKGETESGAYEDLERKMQALLERAKQTSELSGTSLTWVDVRTDRYHWRSIHDTADSGGARSGGPVAVQHGDDGRRGVGD